MSLYNIVGTSSLQAGQPEDVSQVLANFQAIQTILNGGIDDNNIRNTAAIQATKLNIPADTTQILRGDGTWGKRPPTQQIFTAGTGLTYNTPANVIAILVECIGGGGGGGGAPSTGASAVGLGGGGGGGAYAASLIANPAASYTYTVGGGGSGGGAIAGNAGTDTVFGASLVVAKAGGGGLITAGASGVPAQIGGGAGGLASASTGTVKMDGVVGGLSWALAATQVVLGNGGGAPKGAPTGVIGVTTSGSNGVAGTLYGGGGGGSANAQSQASGRTGGNGAGGIIIVTEFYA